MALKLTIKKMFGYGYNFDMMLETVYDKTFEDAFDLMKAWGYDVPDEINEKFDEIWLSEEDEYNENHTDPATPWDTLPWKSVSMSFPTPGETVTLNVGNKKKTAYQYYKAVVMKEKRK